MAQPFNSNIHGDYNYNNDDGYGDNDNADMSSSIISFGKPDVDEIALETALMASGPPLDIDIQDGAYDDYDFVNDYEDVYMPDIVESFDEPDQNDVAWQIDLLAMDSAPNEAILDSSDYPH